MAATVTWQCQLCASRYALLFELVGHVRAAHSADCNLNFVCQVKGCPRIFQKTNTWYKHVRAQHKEEYFKKEVSTVEVSHPYDHEMDDVTDNLEKSHQLVLTPRCQTLIHADQAQLFLKMQQLGCC